MPARSPGTIGLRGATKGVRLLIPEGLFFVAPQHSHRASRGQNPLRHPGVLCALVFPLNDPEEVPMRVHAQQVLHDAVQAIMRASPHDWTHEIAEKGNTVIARASDPAGVVAVVFTLSVGGCGVM